VRQILPLILGLLIGVIGATLFTKSLPPAEGSVEETVEKTKAELKTAERRIAALEAQAEEDGRWVDKRGDSFKDRASKITRDLKEGRDVEVTELFNVFKPSARQLSPLLSRMRQLEMNNRYEASLGEYARAYGLNQDQLKVLENHLKERAELNAKRYVDVLTDDDSTFRDMAKLEEEMYFDDDLDAVMSSMLSGDELEAYRNDRLVENAERVQAEADRRVGRLDTLVGLDKGQKDSVFAIMARSSDHFDEQMQFEGLDNDSARVEPGQTRDEAVLAVLTEEQQQTYETKRDEQRQEIDEELGKLGLKMPEDWDYLEESGW